jgi:hypothetical protein
LNADCVEVVHLPSDQHEFKHSPSRSPAPCKHT